MSDKNNRIFVPIYACSHKNSSGKRESQVENVNKPLMVYVIKNHFKHPQKSIYLQVYNAAVNT